MGTTERRLDRAARVSDDSLRRLGYELRCARVGAGLSQRWLAARTGIGASEISRLERGLVLGAPLRTYIVLFTLLGHTLNVKAYPDGTSLRDAAHVALLRRLAAILGDGIRMRTEVPLGRPGGLRCWDVELVGGDWTCKLEAETVFSDAQAIDRRIALKMQDDDVDLVILLVADTRRNRAALVAARPLLAARFPADPRSVLRSLRAGQRPTASGIVLL